MLCSDCKRKLRLGICKKYSCECYPKYPDTLGILYSFNKLRPEYEEYIKELEHEGVVLSNHQLVVYLWDWESAQNYGQFYKAEIAGLLNTASPRIVNIRDEYAYFTEDKDGYKELIDYVIKRSGKMIFLGEPNTDELKWAENYCKGKVPYEVITKKAGA